MTSVELNPKCPSDPEVEAQLDRVRMLTRLKEVEEEAQQLRRTLGMAPLIEAQTT